MRHIESLPKPSIWHRDLNESKIFRFVFVWLVAVPWLLVIFVSVAAVVGVMGAILGFIGIWGSMWLYDWWQQRRTAPPEFALGPHTTQASLLHYAFDDYWYLRDCFIRAMLEIQAPGQKPWHTCPAIQRLIALWEQPELIDSIHRRLDQVGPQAKTGYARMLYLHAIAKRVGKTFRHRPHSPHDTETIRSFLQEVTAVLISLDQWFAPDQWPEDFQPSGEWSEFKNRSIQSAVIGTPFLP